MLEIHDSSPVVRFVLLELAGCASSHLRKIVVSIHGQIEAKVENQYTAVMENQETHAF